jgi:hypothetical protein
MRPHLTLWSRIDRDRLATMAALTGALMLVVTALVVETLCLGFGSWGLWEWSTSVRLEQEYVGLKRALYARLGNMSWEEGVAVQDGYEREIQAAAKRAFNRQPSSWAPFLVVVCPCVLALNAYMLSRGERGLLRRLKPVRAELGSAPKTTRALYEACIAAGHGFPPTLFIIDEQTVNAAIVGAPGTGAFKLLVTEGLLQIPAEQQRAIFASLLGRKRSGRSAALTGTAGIADLFARLVGAELIALQRRWTDLPGERPPLIERLVVVSVPVIASSLVGVTLVLLMDASAKGLPVAAIEAATDPYKALGIVGLSLLAGIIVALPAILAISFAQRTIALLGDEEGMLISKDPCASLEALKTGEVLGTRVWRAAPYAHLFWCWPGESRSILSWRNTARRRAAASESGPWTAAEEDAAGS